MLALLLSKSWFRFILNSLVSFALGFGASEIRRDPEPIVVDRVVETQGKTVVVEKIVTKTIKPDGTVVEQVREREKTAEVKTRKEEHKSLPPPPSLHPTSQYSLDLRYQPAFDRAPSWKDSQVVVGARLGSTGLWGTIGYDLKYKQVSIGIRYEW